MNLTTALLLAGAGYVGYKVISGGSIGPAASEPDDPFSGFVVPPFQQDVPEPQRTAVIRGSRLLEGVSMQREPDEPQLVAQLRPQGFVTVVCWATVRNGIWHERHASSGAWGATEERHTGLNACGFARWRGPARKGVAVPRETPTWAAVPGCPQDGSGAPTGNRLTWLSSDVRVDIGDKLSVTLWNAGDRYRGNDYDLRIEWAWTPPA